MPFTVAQSGSIATDVDYQGHAWSNVANALTANADFASIAVAANGNTDWLQVTGFGFDTLIPSNATILGILVEVEISVTVNSTYQTPTVQLVSGGVDIGDLDGTNSPSLTTTPSYKVIGGRADLWNIAGDITAQVRASNFGIKVRLRSDPGNSGPATLKIHHIRVTVFYKTGTVVGPKFGSTTEDLNDVIGVWNNPSNVLTENGQSATTTTAGDDRSNNLLVTGFNANLPEFVADSLTIMLEYKISSDGGSTNTLLAQLVSGSNDLGDQQLIGPSLTGTLTWYTIGDGDWNHTWTRSEVNASTFGVKIQVHDSNPAAVISVDAVRITFEYTAVAGSGVVRRTISIGLGIHM